MSIKHRMLWVYPERSESPSVVRRSLVHTPNSYFTAAFVGYLNIMACYEGSKLHFTHKQYGMITGMLPRVLATISLASMIILALVLTLTSPATAGPFGLLILFISAYLSFVGVISFFLFGVNRLIIMVSQGMTVRKPLRPMLFRRAYYFSTVLAAAPVMLIGLQSVNSIGIYEVLLVVIFEVVACVYVGRQMK